MKVRLMIDPSFRDLLERNSLADYQALLRFGGGQLFKRNRYRSVVRIELEGRALFLKRHYKIPLGDFLRRLLKFQRPLSPGRAEWESALALKELKIPTFHPVAWGERSILGIPIDSIFISSEISGAERLEKFITKRFPPPLDREGVKLKRGLTHRLAQITRVMHGAGLNHQDFYLGHVFINEGQLFIIDLQRVEKRREVGLRRRIKDLAALNFTAPQGIVSRTDRMRFLLDYLGLLRLRARDKILIKNIERKTGRIRRHTERLLARRTRARSWS